jgi:hypothetical protein
MKPKRLLEKEQMRRRMRKLCGLVLGQKSRYPDSVKDELLRISVASQGSSVVEFHSNHHMD